MLQKFLGRSIDSYAMWRFRLVTKLLEKGYWKDTRGKDCYLEITMKATNIILSAIRDVPMSVFMDWEDNPFSTIELLDQQFASTRSPLLYAVHATLFEKTTKWKRRHVRLHRRVPEAICSTWKNGLKCCFKMIQGSTSSFQYGPQLALRKHYCCFSY